MNKNIFLKNNETNTKLLIEYLEEIISDQMIFNSFIKDIKIIENYKNKIIIQTPSNSVFSVLKNDYKKIIEKAITEILERQVKVIFIVKGQYTTNIKKRIETAEKKIKTNIINKYTFNNYVCCKFNKQVLKASKLIIKEQGVYNPLFIHSDSGLGKTHLLHAIGNEIIKTNKKVLYINPDRFTFIITRAMKKSQEELNILINNILEFDYLLFDDIQSLGDRTKTLSVLFNIINRANEKESQIVIIADKTPHELGGFEDRFITRFSKGLTLEIKKPNLDDLIEILKNKLESENLNPKQWEDKALNFIARNYSHSIRSIEGAIKRIKFFSLDDQFFKYTHAVISKIFDQLKINKEELTPQRIVYVVSQYYKLPTTDIFGKTRKQEIVLARHISMWLIRSINQLSFKQIGNIFSRDHSTIMSAINKIDTSIKINSAVKLAIKQIESKISLVN